MRKLITILLVAIAGLILLLSTPSRVVSYEADELEPQTPWQFAAEQVTEKWGVTHLNAFYRLVNAESNWNHEAQNPHSSAYGLGQFLDSTWDTVGCSKELAIDNPHYQVSCTIAYVEARYGDPVNAWSVWQKQKWY